MGKKIAVLLENHYQTLEAWYPYLRLREAGHESLFVGTGKEKYLSKNGYTANEDISIDDLRAEEFSGVIIPGGYAPDLLRTNEKIINFVREMYSQNKMVASICHGGWVLASAEIIENKKITSWQSIQDDIKHAGANFVDQEVVIDEYIITSRNPNDLPAFMSTILNFLKEN